MKTMNFRITYFIAAILLTFALVACSDDERGITPLDGGCASCIAGLNNSIMDATGRVKDPSNAEWFQVSLTFQGVAGFAGYNGWNQYPIGEQIAANGTLYSSGYNQCGIFPGQAMTLTTMQPGITFDNGPLGKSFQGLHLAINGNPSHYLAFNNTVVTPVTPGQQNLDYRGIPVPNKLTHYVDIYINGAFCAQWVMD